MENEHHALWDYTVPSTQDSFSSIVKSPINAKNFKIKLSIIQMIKQNQFKGAAVEDLHAHLSKFMQI